MELMNQQELNELMSNPQAGAVNDTVDVQKRLWLLKKIGEEKERIKAILQEQVAYYKDRQEKLDQLALFHQNAILAYLRATNQQNVPTPLGVVSQRRQTVRTWPDDDVLITFSQKMNIPLNVKEIVKPDKKAIEEFIRRNNIAPEGYSEHQELGITVRSPKKKQEEMSNEMEEVNLEVDPFAFL